MATRILRGGDKLKKALEDLAKKVGRGGSVSIGFFEGQEYPDGTPIAKVASIQEFGAKVEVEAHEQTLYRSLAKDGSLNKGGRFVKAEKSNFATTHSVEAHEIIIPPRPFMRNTISEYQDRWGDVLAASLKEADYDLSKSLNAMGEVISDQMRDSLDQIEPGNAPSTIRAKGFDKPLVDTGTMRRAISHEVSDD